MKRRAFLEAVGAAMLFRERGGAVMEKRRVPNLLFVLTDDQAKWAVGAYGNTDIHTPNIDRLASEGMRFNYAITAPVCSPSRAMIMAGLYAHQVGIDDWISPQEKEGIDPSVPLLSEVFRRAGYIVGLIGKWHLGKEPQYHPLRRGFDYFFGFLGGGNRPKDPTLEVDGKERQLSGFLIDLMTDAALDFLRRHRDRPFVLFFHTREPHKPYLPVPDRDIAPYRGKRFRVPTVPGFPEERLQEEYRGYYASITSVDRNLGRLLDGLDALGVGDDTIVVFMGDNGYMIGHHGLEAKGNAWTLREPRRPRPNMFDHSILVPLIVRWRGVIPAGTVCDELVTSLDFFPTFLDILREGGFSTPEGLKLEGQSMLALWRGEKVPWREAVFLLYDMEHGKEAHMRMVRTKRWKLVLHLGEGEEHELYDLQNDPEEEHNLYGDPSVKAIQDELTGKLREWQGRVNDPLAP